MPANLPCPDVQAFQQLLQCQVPLSEGEQLVRHLEECPACADSVERLLATDTLADAVRTQEGAAERPRNERVENLIQQLCQLRPAGAVPSPTGSDASGEVGSACREPAPESYSFLAPAQRADELGRLGPYRVLKVLGSGGMGVVFQAEDTLLKRLVALKAMKPALAASTSAGKRFLREAQATAAIKHDHIVTIYQVGEDRGVPFLAMELLEGETLNERVKREGWLPVAEVLRIGREMAAGLAAAHKRGLIHRDVKPGNVWLETDRGRVKIVDFGLARAAGDDTHLTQTGTIVGTPAYMAPEQAKGGAVDHRCDLFSLGCVLYRLCTGKLPFTGIDTMSMLLALATEQPLPPRQLNPDVPPALNNLILRLLAKNLPDRPASAQAVVEAILAIERDGASPTRASWSSRSMIRPSKSKSCTTASSCRTRRASASSR
ncbi:MAG: serine/threonine protein kinase [Planctomycetes bacterium]|nr:serine/threonine protein kinase [Planctomycetota bacterium]